MRRRQLGFLPPFILSLLVLNNHACLSSGFSNTKISCITDRNQSFRQPVDEPGRGGLINSRLYAYETEIGVWTLAFASSHIGLSAIRSDLIDRIGTVAKENGLVDTGACLPDVWPGDEAGQEIFPTAEIAGRQLYRIFYTIVSFGTLGNGFYAYLNSLGQDSMMMIPDKSDSFLFYAIASLSWGVSIASLVNPSPLSLVPVYESTTDNDTFESTSSIAVRRNDSRKLQAYGLTRITRHPLILPVVTWAIATAAIMGGNSRDYLFFGILALYAVAGCFAQDLRVLREEGSVGTVFNPKESLQDFFRETSFIPFQALIDSRQSISDVIREVPWGAALVGTAIGYQLQQVLVEFLIGFTVVT